MQLRADIRLAAFAPLLLCLLTGCGAPDSMALNVSGSFAATPPGPSAVLRVTSERTGPSRSGQVIWGNIHTPGAQADFAGQLAYAAEREGGMTVIAPAEVEKRLRAAGLEPTLEPTHEELRQCVLRLGLASYLTAHIKCSCLRYALFWSSARVGFDVACHSAEDGRTLWQVEMDRKSREGTVRAITARALCDAFRSMRGDAREPGTWCE